MLINQMESYENNMIKEKTRNSRLYIYINPSVLYYFQQPIIEFPSKLTIIDRSNLTKKALDLVVTDEPLEALQLKQKYDCDVCFINNHSNDCIDFAPTYEMSSDQVSQKLQKLLTNYQN